MSAYVFIAESKYAGRCAGCGDPYHVGDPIFWAKGEPCYHEACGPDATEATPPPSGGTRTATAAERQTGAEKVGEARLALLERHVADHARAFAAIERALGGLVAIVADLVPAEDPRRQAVTDGVAELRVALSTHPLDRAKRQAAATGDDDEIPF